MNYLYLPLLVIVVIGVLCLDVKVGFWVSDKTEQTGFSTGYYMMTVMGLIAAQISLVAWLVS